MSDLGPSPGSPKERVWESDVYPSDFFDPPGTGSSHSLTFIVTRPRSSGPETKNGPDSGLESTSDIGMEIGDPMVLYPPF